MKKSLVLFSILLSSCMLSGCGNNSQNNSQVTESIVEEETTTITTITTTTITTTTSTTSETTETTVETLVNPNRKTVVRDVCWGDTKDIVKSLEKTECMVEDDNGLLYDTTVANYKATLMYTFDSDYGLYNISYNFPDETGGNGVILIGQYKKLVETLTAKYGEPTTNITKPMDSLYDYCDSDAEALEIGSLAYLTTWELDDTTIEMVMAQVNYKISIVIFFHDTNFEAPINTSGL